MFDGEAFGAEIVEAVKAYVASIEAPLREEIAALQRRLDALPQPADGKDADPAVVAAMVAAAVADIPPAAPGKDADLEAVRAMIAEAIAALPAPQEGKSVTAEELTPLIAEEARKAAAELPPAPAGKDADPDVTRALVAEAVAALPKPQDGKSVSLDDVQPMVAEAVQRAVAALPAPKDGEPGRDGIAAPVVAAAIKDHEGELVLTLTDGTILRTGIFDGKDGKDGEPGLDVDDIDLTLAQDGRTVVFGFERGALKQSFEIAFPVVLDRGVYREGQTYEHGDAVTWGGSLWIAQRETSAKPETGSDWRLAVKRGRDGKDATPTERRPSGPIVVA